MTLDSARLAEELTYVTTQFTDYSGAFEMPIFGEGVAGDLARYQELTPEERARITASAQARWDEQVRQRKRQEIIATNIRYADSSEFGGGSCVTASSESNNIF